MSRPLKLATVTAVAVLLGAVGGAGVWLYLGLERPFAAWSGESVTVELAPGLDAGTMLRRLRQAGVVRDTRALRLWLRWSGRAAELHAGEYRFERPLSGRQALRKLIEGEVVLHPVTLPEGLTLLETAERLERGGFGAREALLEAFRDPQPVADIDPTARDLEGYLFPDTYHFPRGVSPEDITRALVGRFRAVTGADYVTGAVEVGLDLHGAVTLASLVEAETSVPAERPRIARVFLNRLEREMKLECDPTVRYALEREGREVGRLTYGHLRFDSPWNTYVNPGLPPGPIANPGRESLWAVVRPAEGDDLFFVAAPEGGHRFSPDLDSHLEAVAEWRRYSRSSR